MAGTAPHQIIIDLNQFKLHLHLRQNARYTFHFNSPSRRFYLSLIALVVHEMKKKGKIISIPLRNHHHIIALLNETIGGSAGSSEEKQLLSRIYRKWKDALPDLENAPLFKVVGRRKNYDFVDSRYGFSETDKDTWANLFEHKGSHGDVSLRFSIDRLGVELDDVAIIYGTTSKIDDPDGWKRYIASLEGAKDRNETNRERLEDPSAPAEQNGQLIEFKQGSPTGKWFALIAAVCVAALFSAGIWIFLEISTSQSDARLIIEKMAYPLPRKPSIVVMPFVNLSGNTAMDKVVDGITDNIVTLLSKVPQLFVISSKSSFAYKGKQVTMQQMAEDLGVRYVLEGSVHKEDDKVQVSVKLVDAIEDHHLWTERYDRQFKDIFDIQDEIALSVCSNLRVLLSEGEQARVVRGMTKNVEAFNLYLQADAQRQLWTKESEAKARDLLQQALAIDPGYIDAWHLLASTHTIDARFGYGDSREGSLRAAEDAVNEILALDDTNSVAYAVLGVIHLWRGEHDKAIIARKKAYALNPNNSGNIAGLAWTMFASGEPEEALVLIKEAMRLNPSFPDWWLMILEESYRLNGRYDEAIETIHEELRRLDNYFTRTRLALYYAQTGRDEEAQLEIAKVLQLKPGMNLEIWKNAQFFKNKEWLERDLNDLKRVGLPEPDGTPQAVPNDKED